jgi:integral membrane protein
MDVSFRRYRLMSFITGSTLLSLFATLALHYIDLRLWKDISLLVRIDGIAHGIILYPIYMIASFNMVVKHKLSIMWLGLMLLAGFVPGVAFAMEWWMHRRLYPNG